MAHFGHLFGNIFVGGIFAQVLHSCTLALTPASPIISVTGSAGVVFDADDIDISPQPS